MNARVPLLVAGLSILPAMWRVPPTIAASPPQSCEEPSSGPYNILMIVLDDVGTDKLAMYGETPGSNVSPCTTEATCFPDPCPYPYAPTPSLDALASCGIRFTNFYVNPLCSTTRAALMTGRYAFRTGMVNLVSQTSKVDNSEVFIPELLKNGFSASSPDECGASSQDYMCGAFGKWHLTYPNGDGTHPIDNGFDVFAGPIGNNSNHFSWTKIITSSPCAPTTILCPEAPSGCMYDLTCVAPDWCIQTPAVTVFDATETRADAVEWINSLPSSQRFFAYVSFNAPHSPYQVPPFELLSEETVDYLECEDPWGGPYSPGEIAASANEDQLLREQRVFYRAMLEAVDTEIGNLIDGIDDEQMEKTVVIVVADNGTPRGISDNPPHLFNHGKSTMYQIGIRVPMIVAGPIVEEEDRGEVCSQLVGAVDLWRTIGDIAGASEEDYENNVGPLPFNDGVSFASLLVDPQGTPVREFAFSQTFNGNHAYDPTEWGPYELGCPSQWFPPSQSPLLWCCDRVVFGEHQRAITDGQYKLIRKQIDPGGDGGTNPDPPYACIEDSPPEYTSELYDIINDPEEEDDLHSEPPSSIETDLLEALEALSGE